MYWNGLICFCGVQGSGLIETWDVLKLVRGGGRQKPTYARLIETWDVLKSKGNQHNSQKVFRLIETWDVLKCLSATDPRKSGLD